MLQKPMLGTDPEIVAVGLSSEKLRQFKLPVELLGKPMPGYFALPVQNPLKPKLPLRYGDVSPDGGATEFTVLPTNDVDTMVSRIGANLRQITELLDTYSGCTASVVSNYWMDPTYIKLLPEDPYGNSCSLQVLGCDPDYSVYGFELPERPDPRVYPYRTLGGHIHIELGEQFMQDRTAVSLFIAGLDLLIGSAATYLCDDEPARQRKQLYGWAGMVRFGKDRVEYRTLPAQALIQTPLLCRAMFEATQRFATWALNVYDTMPQSDAIDVFQQNIGTYNELIETIVPAINTHDVQACADFQDAFVKRLSSDANIKDVIDELRATQMPDDYSLHGWE